MRSRRTCCRRKVCPFWLARPASERFAQTAAVQAGIVPPRGAWDRSLVLLETPPAPASHYIHPEFGFFRPTPRFRRRLRVALACLVVATSNVSLCPAGALVAAPVGARFHPTLARCQRLDLLSPSTPHNKTSKGQHGPALLARQTMLHRHDEFLSKNPTRHQARSDG